MGKVLYYEPVTPIKEHSFGITACQIRQEMGALFGEYPFILNKHDIPKLETLQSLWVARVKNDHELNGLWDEDLYGDIIEVINKNPGGIKVYEKY